MPSPNRLERRPLRLTAQHVARVHRDVAKVDIPSPFTPMSDADFETYADEMLAQNRGGPFWVLAYGSLIWKSAFDHVDMRTCLVPGWRRSYCLNLRNWRATPDQPGLMLGLDRGGSCKGVVYRMPDDEPNARMLRLLRREMSQHEDKPWHRWLTVTSEGERFRALGFWCAPSLPDPDLVRLPLEDQVRRLARAVGYGGSCAEYLLNTVEHLEALGLCDSYLWRLQDLVAAEIEALPG
jgi:glutathione-specific gamma-glutamylcyclotransferase